MQQNVRILLVDDHALVRDMLQQRLETESFFEVVGTGSSAEEGMQLALELRPDVILMDIDMPGLTCFEAARRILAALSDVRIIFLSAYTHDHYIEEALSVGALGYLTKGDPPEKIVEAIREVIESRACFSQEVQDRIVIDAGRARLKPRAKTRASTLTPREVEVLRYIAKGYTKKQIAPLLHVSVKTVEKHSGNLMHKLAIHDRVSLARFAIREGLAEA